MIRWKKLLKYRDYERYNNFLENKKKTRKLIVKLGSPEFTFKTRNNSGKMEVLATLQLQCFFAPNESFERWSI